MSRLSEIRIPHGINENNLVQRDSYGNILETRTFTSSGDIDEGSFVALREDGKVEEIQQFVVSETRIINEANITNQRVFSGSSSNEEYHTQIVWNPIENVMVYIYGDDNDDDIGKIVVYRISQDGSLTMIGNEVPFTTGRITNLSASYNKASNTIVCIYDDDGITNVRVFTVFDGIVNLGPVVNTLPNLNIPAHASHENKPEVFIIGNRTDDSNYINGIVGTISGTTINLGNSVRIIENNYLMSGYRPEIIYDPSSGFYAILFYDQNSPHNGSIMYCPVTESNIIDVDNASTPENIYFGSPHFRICPIYNFKTKNIMVVFSTTLVSVKFSPRNNVNTSHITQYSNNHHIDGVSISHRTVEYIPLNNTIVFGYRGSSPVNGRIVFISFNDNFITVSESVVFTNNSPQDIKIFYHPILRKIVVSYTNDSDNRKGYVSLLDVESTSTNADKWIGVAEQTATDSEEVNIRTFGGTAQTNQTGLIPGERYFLDDEGLLTRHPLDGRYVGVAETSSSIIMTTNPVEQDNIPKYYTLPSSDGDASQILETDGNGNVSWRENNSIIPDYIGYFDGTSTGTSIEWHGNGEIVISKEANHQYRLTFPTSYPDSGSYIVQLSTATGDGNVGFGTAAQVHSHFNDRIIIWFVHNDPGTQSEAASGTDNNIRCFVTIYPIT